MKKVMVLSVFFLSSSLMAMEPVHQGWNHSYEQGATSITCCATSIASIAMFGPDFLSACTESHGDYDFGPAIMAPIMLSTCLCGLLGATQLNHPDHSCCCDCVRYIRAYRTITKAPHAQEHME